MQQQTQGRAQWRWRSQGLRPAPQLAATAKALAPAPVPPRSARVPELVRLPRCCQEQWSCFVQHAGQAVPQQVRQQWHWLCSVRWESHVAAHGPLTPVPTQQHQRWRELWLATALTGSAEAPARWSAACVTHGARLRNV